MKNTEIPHNKKSICFIGFMGVGKTTVANIVAAHLNRKFIDIDEQIEKKFGIKTTDIFEQFGEKVFRDNEKELTIQYCKQPEKIISLGGGAFTQEDIKIACLTYSIVVYLDISWDYWKQRIDELIDSRPILQQKSLEEVKQLFEERKAMYSDHHIKVLTDNLTAEQVASEVLELVNTIS